MSLKLDGKKLSLEIEERLTDYISSNKKIAKRAPGLAVIRIGEDPASGVYVNNKEKACSRIGIKSFIFHLKESVEQKEVEQLINKLKKSPDDLSRAKSLFRWSILYMFGICLLLLISRTQLSVEFEQQSMQIFLSIVSLLST